MSQQLLEHIDTNYDEGAIVCECSFFMSNHSTAAVISASVHLIYVLSLPDAMVVW
jgi:hypothetical protein